MGETLSASATVGVAYLTTIVLTRRRQALLTRALASLASQRGVKLEVLIVVDDCPSTLTYVADLAPSFGAVSGLRSVHALREADDRSGPVRIGHLRETALGLVTTPWVAFLDDDNVLDPDHYLSLLGCAATGASAAHSWRSLWTPDGRPHRLVDSHPWCRDPSTARALFDMYEAAGIYRRGSHVVRDQVVPFRRATSMVDTSEWLFETAFLEQFSLRHAYTVEDWTEARSEDSKLLDQIVATGVAIPSTGKPTLRYFLGGYSNNPEAEAAALTGWLR